MYKQLLNLSLMILLATGCKLSAFEQTPTSNENPAVSVENTSIARHSDNKNSASNATSPVGKSVAQVTDEVCADPSKPCHHKNKRFDDWELSFKMPAKLRPNKVYSSAPFYAVILKTYEIDKDCDSGEYVESIEAERKELQANQLERKVFASFQCPNMAAVQYEFDGKWSADKESLAIGNFLAIYVGKNQTEAEEAWRFLKSEFPNATLKKMTATYEQIEQ